MSPAPPPHNAARLKLAARAKRALPGQEVVLKQMVKKEPGQVVQEMQTCAYAACPAGGLRFCLRSETRYLDMWPYLCGRGRRPRPRE